MKKGLPFLVTGIIIIAVAIFGFTNAERLTKNMVEEKLEDFGITVDKSDDGSWNINIGGTSIELSDSNWPDNEFMKQVPKPEFEPTVASTSENSFSVAFLGVGVEELTIMQVTAWKCPMPWTCAA